MKKLFFLSLLITTLGIHAQTTAVPDNDFEQRLIDLGYDDVIDGQVLTANINTITSFEISSGSYNPSNLTGIEDFTALETLKVTGRPALTSVDLSQNVNLISVDLSGNFNLPTINVSSSPNLTFLKLNGTGIAHLNVSSNTNLSDLIVGPNSNLLSLNASNTSITALDLSINSNLNSLDVSNTSIITLDLGVNSNLNSIDVSNNSTLTLLNLRNGSNTNITNYNSSGTPNLTNCIVVDNQNYSTTNWTNRDNANTFCETIYIPDDNLEQALIDLGYDTAPLDDFISFDNAAFITSLDLSYSNISDTTGIRFFVNLQELNISGNNLNALDISNNNNLIELNISNNNFTELDISNNNNLTVLSISSNNFTELDVSNHSNLRELLAQNNSSLSTLNINNTDLELLYVQSTALTSLDLSAHFNLNNLIVGNSTVLTALNVQNGNNSNMGAGNFVSLSTPNLSCITVDDPSYSNSTWINVDSANTFSTNCGPANAFNFDGVNDYAVATNPSILDITSGTVEMRVKPELKATSQTILGYRSSNGGSTKYLFNLLGNLTGIGFWNGSTYQTISYTFNANEWYNISITDDDSGSTTVYVNGLSIGTFNSEFGTATGSNLNLYVGVDFPLNEYFKGDIGDIRIWNTVKVGGSLSCDDAPTGTDLLAHFNFNQGFSSSNNSTVNTILDSTGTINNLQLTNVALSGSTSNWVDTDNNVLQDAIPPMAISQDITVTLDANGQVTVDPTLVNNGSTDNCGDIVSYTLSQDTFSCADAAIDNNRAIQFNGIDQHIAVADDASNDISGSYTMSCWVKYDATGPALQRPVSKPSALDGTGYCIAMSNTGSVALTYIDASSGAPNGLGTGNGVVPANTWTHVAVTFNDINNVASVYVNGVEAATGVITPLFPNSSQPLFIGTEGLGTSALTFRRFKGDIDEVRIWDVARTEAQIANNMNQRIEPQAGLVGLYRFNEGTGTVVNDASGVAPNGNFVNLDAATDWVAGAPAQSLAGQIEVDFTVTDSSGNSDTTTATIALEAEAPTVITQDINVTISCGNTVYISPNDIDDGSTASCGIASWSLDINNFNSTMLGDNTVTLTVVDALGNSSSATATVTVVESNSTILYVNQFATGLSNGSSWEDGFIGLSNALVAAAGCPEIEEIWVAGGTYRPFFYPFNYTITNGISNRDFTFHLINGVKIYGGFNGTETSIDQRDITANPTILSGNIGNQSSAADNAYHVVTSVLDNAETRLDGFIIEAGVTSTNETTGLTIEGIDVRRRLGGGISNHNSSTVFANITIRNNTADFGAGIYNKDTNNTTYINTVIHNNTTPNFGLGGGMYNQGASYTATNLLVANNTASGGPAIFNDLSSNSTLNNLTIFNNTSSSSSSIGSAIFANNSSGLTIRNTVMYNNTRDISTANSSTLSGSNNYVQFPSLFGSPTGFNQLTSDPFTDSNDVDGLDDIYGTEDDGLIPLETSVLVDAGDSAFNSLTTDIAGQIRNLGATIDVGAYEYQSKLTVAPKVYLQGAMLSSTDNVMRDDLRAGGYLPTMSPYADALTCNASVFNTGGTTASGLPEDDIVDWVFVELRDETDNTLVITATSALLQRDGDIVGTDGISSLEFLEPFKNYYITVKHRNHLGVLTSSPITLNGSSTLIDFTNENAPITFGTNAQTNFGMPANTLSLWAGNVNGDAVVQYSGTTPDTPSILSNVLNDSGNFLNFPTYTVNGYNNHDVNMDGATQYSGTEPDTPFLLQNILAHPGNFLNFSTFAIQEQLPEN